MKVETERICFNCNHFYPDRLFEPTEFGICLDDNAFEPFIDELLGHSNYDCCQNLIKEKRFHGDQEACANFEEVEEIESIEIDDSSPLGQELHRLSEAGELNRESFTQALLEEKIRNLDWKTMPVDQYAKQLQSAEQEKVDDAISTLHGMMAMGNKEAYNVLFQYFIQLPPPEKLEEVHFKIKLLDLLGLRDTKRKLIPKLIDELYHTTSNNTTRQWISAIFQYLSLCSRDKICDPLGKMLQDKRFSHRLKRQIKRILEDPDFF